MSFPNDDCMFIPNSWEEMMYSPESPLPAYSRVFFFLRHMTFKLENLQNQEGQSKTRLEISQATGVKGSTLSRVLKKMDQNGLLIISRNSYRFNIPDRIKQDLNLSS